MSTVTADPTIRRQVVAAARAELAADPDAPIGQIAQRAGISRATFYRHFGSRERLLETVALEPRPSSRARILAAAQDMLLRESLAAMSMDDLARTADVSRGTLYRIFPGKAALMDGLIEAFSPLENVRAVIAQHASEPPEVVLPLLSAAIVGAAGARLGLMRAMFLEITSGSETSISGLRRGFATTLALLAEYMSAQMAAGRMRPMHPLLALQAFIGPIFFHLLSRPVVDQVLNLPVDAESSVAQLTRLSVDALTARA